MKEAKRVFASNVIHELTNTYYRSLSLYDPIGEEIKRSEARAIPAYTSTEWAIMYGFGHYLENMADRAIGIYVEPDPRIAKVVNRLQEVGVPDLEKLIVNAAVHGDGPLQEIQRLYELNRLAEEPSIEEMFFFGLESKEMREKYSPLLEKYGSALLGDVIREGNEYFIKRQSKAYLTTANFVFLTAPEDPLAGLRKQKPLCEVGTEGVYPKNLGILALSEEWRKEGQEIDWENLPKMSSGDLPFDFRTVYSLVGADLLGRPLECRGGRCYFMNAALERDPSGRIVFMPLGRMDARGDFVWTF